MSDGRVVIDIEADDSEFRGAVSGLGKVLGAGMGAMAAGIGIAAGALGAFSAKGVDLASDLQEVQNVVDTTFGDGAGVINEWAKAAGESFGISELAAKNWTGQMGAMLKSMGVTGDAQLGMSTGLAGLAGDFASFYNLDHEAAWEKLRSGMAGETEPLKQLGINMSVANLEAYALSQGIKKSYESMTEAEKAQLRYGYLMQATADAHGDFSKTSDSLANQQRTTALMFEELSGTLGQGLIPAISDILGGLMPTLKELMPAMGAIGQGLGALFAGDASGADKLAEGLSGVVDGLVDIITGLVPGLVAAAADVIVAIAQALPGLLPVLIGALLDGIMALVDAIPTVIPAMLGAVLSALTTIVLRLVAELPNIMTALLDTLVAMVPLVITAAITLLMGLVEALPVVIPALLDAVIGGIDAVLSLLPTLIPQLIDAAVKLFFALALAVPQIVTALIGAVFDLIDTVIDLLPTLIPTLLAAAIQLFEAIVEAAPIIIPELQKAGADLIGGLIDGILGSVGKLKDAVVEAAQGALDAAKDFLGIKSPSTVFAWVGKMVDEGWSEGIEKNARGVVASIKSTVGDMVDAATEGDLASALAVSPGFVPAAVGYGGGVGPTARLLTVELNINAPGADAGTVSGLRAAGSDILAALTRELRLS